MPRSRSGLLLLLAALAGGLLASPAAACPFCTEQRGATLIEDFKQATLVLYGKFANPQLDPEEKSEFVIEVALKRDKTLGDKKVVTLPKYVRDTKNKFLVFCDVYKGKIDPYRGVGPLVGEADVVKYLEGARKLKDKSLAARLRYCFDYLDSPELEISLDAYREFANADYKD